MTEMIAFSDAFKSYWKHMFNWSGRATRAEFWFSLLAVFILNYILKLFDIGILLALVTLLNIFAYISLIVRRLHDIGKSGFFIWKTLLYTILFFIGLAVLFAVLDYIGIGAIFSDIRSVIFIAGGFIIIGGPIFIYPLIYGFIPSEKRDNKYGSYE